jgi:Na+-transporting NADH:ubiquinone oxidoreductase subunit NqrD
VSAISGITMLACSVCFGASDSPLAQGTNMGVFFMLGVTVLMLTAFASFFIYLIRRQRTA